VNQHERERALDQALSELARREASRGAPAGLEQRLRASFRARHMVSQGAGHRLRFLRMGLVLLFGGAAAALVVMNREEGPSAVTGGGSGPSQAETPSAMEVGGREHPFLTGLGEFQAIGAVPSDSRIEAGIAATMSVPAILPVLLGWPADPAAMGGRIQAVVLWAEDGVARAVRFLPADSSPDEEPTSWQ
jgi:hypothetical protein